MANQETEDCGPDDLSNDAKNALTVIHCVDVAIAHARHGRHRPVQARDVLHAWPLVPDVVVLRPVLVTCARRRQRAPHARQQVGSKHDVEEQLGQLHHRRVRTDVLELGHDPGELLQPRELGQAERPDELQGAQRPAPTDEQLHQQVDGHRGQQVDCEPRPEVVPPDEPQVRHKQLVAVIIPGEEVEHHVREEYDVYARVHDEVRARPLNLDAEPEPVRDDHHAVQDDGAQRQVPVDTERRLRVHGVYPRALAYVQAGLHLEHLHLEALARRAGCHARDPLLGRRCR
mmetsp:Transcript_21460/g.72984  ORF Transcript_21460/g.72984 Transcript_21460/m.72984 type:complete len:287 (-) Transcript_21460:310-1170(-)